MTKRPRIILHVGAPKCGSSALQSALSAAPRLKSKTGEVLSYSALRPSGSDWAPMTGRLVKIGRSMSVGGYVSCPNFLSKSVDGRKTAAGLDRIYQTAKPGFTPVMSQEGWYSRASVFQELLPHWFEPSETAPQIDVIANVRPPIDWLNAAYFQWGVWSKQTVGTWMDRTNLSVRMGQVLKEWSDLPNVTLKLRFGGDVVANFEDEYGVTLPKLGALNTTQTPAMIGFLLRNSRFRSTGHDVEAEFTVQRWCRFADRQRPWALSPRHIAKFKDMLEDDIETLFDLAPQAADRALQDPRWTSYEPYYDALARGPSDLANISDLTELFGTIRDGLLKAQDQIRGVRAQIPPIPAAGSENEAWDAAISVMLDQLIEADRKQRFGSLRKRIEKFTAELSFQGRFVKPA